MRQGHARVPDGFLFSGIYKVGLQVSSAQGPHALSKPHNLLGSLIRLGERIFRSCLQAVVSPSLSHQKYLVASWGPQWNGAPICCSQTGKQVQLLLRLQSHLLQHFPPPPPLLDPGKVRKTSSSCTLSNPEPTALTAEEPVREESITEQHGPALDPLLGSFTQVKGKEMELRSQMQGECQSSSKALTCSSFFWMIPPRLCENSRMHCGHCCATGLPVESAVTEQASKVWTVAVTAPSSKPRGNNNNADGRAL
nr:uncharacterized protein LOC127482816 [Oryctolagus cuniculus]